MAKLPTTPQGRRIPGYCLHKPSGRAYVRINGKHLPLGDYDPSEGSESMQLYRRLIGEWRSNGFRTPSVEPASGGARGGGAPAMTLRELTAWFLEWAEANYSRSEFLLCRQGLRAACKLYGRSSVADIGVAELRAVRQSLLERSGEEGVAPRKPLGRKTVNALIGRVQRAFAYGASEGQIPPEAAAAVGALKPLKRG